MPNCQNCQEKCQQAEMAHEAAKGRMYATKEFIALLKKVENCQFVEVVRCHDCFYYTPVNDKIGKCVFLIGEHQYVVPDGYCYLGERKEGAD